MDLAFNDHVGQRWRSELGLPTSFKFKFRSDDFPSFKQWLFDKFHENHCLAIAVKYFGKFANLDNEIFVNCCQEKIVFITNENDLKMYLYILELEDITDHFSEHKYPQMLSGCTLIEQVGFYMSISKYNPDGAVNISNLFPNSIEDYVRLREEYRKWLEHQEENEEEDNRQEEEDQEHEREEEEPEELFMFGKTLREAIALSATSRKKKEVIVNSRAYNELYDRRNIKSLCDELEIDVVIYNLHGVELYRYTCANPIRPMFTIKIVKLHKDFEYYAAPKYSSRFFSCDKSNKRKRDIIDCKLCRKRHRRGLCLLVKQFVNRPCRVDLKTRWQECCIYYDFESVIQDERHIPIMCTIIFVRQSDAHSTPIFHFEVVEYDDTCKDEKEFVLRVVYMMIKMTKCLAKHIKKIHVIGHNASKYDLTFMYPILIGRLKSDNPIVRSETDYKNLYFDNVYLIGSLTAPVYVSATSNDLGLTLTFADSIKHLPSSLANIFKLVDPEEYKLCNKWYKDYIKTKYPYLILDSVESFFDVRENNQWIEYDQMVEKDDKYTIEEYNQFKAFAEKCIEERVFNRMSFINILRAYNMFDVIMLFESFHKFRVDSYDDLGIDPLEFVGAPGLAANIAFSQPEFDNVYTINDSRVFEDIHGSIRGGISSCSKRYAEATDDTKLFMIDKNSMYSYAMTQKLPMRFKATIENVETEVVETMVNSEPDDEYWFWMVDIECPKDNPVLYDLPLFPEKISLDGTRNYKLCCTLLDKKKYLVSSFLLAFAYQFGYKVTHVHYVHVFSGGHPLKRYVETNIQKRIIAKRNGDELKVTLYKLLNNSVYGKTIENVLKHKRVTFTQYTRDDINDPVHPYNNNLGSCENFNIFPKYVTNDDYQLNETDTEEEGVLSTEKCLTVYEMNKPIQIGHSILDYSKYDLYKCLMLFKKHLECNLLYTDTDSLLLEVHNCRGRHIHDIVKEIPELNALMDWEGTKDITLWGDEFKRDSQPIEYVGLKSKLYYIRTENPNIHKQAMKGVPRKHKIADRDNEETINIEHFKDTLFHNATYNTISQQWTRHYGYVETSDIEKKALDHYDNKRYTLTDGIHTLPYGHPDIEEEEYFAHGYAVSSDSE